MWARAASCAIRLRTSWRSSKVAECVRSLGWQVVETILADHRRGGQPGVSALRAACVNWTLVTKRASWQSRRALAKTGFPTDLKPSRHNWCKTLSRLPALRRNSCRSRRQAGPRVVAARRRGNPWRRSPGTRRSAGCLLGKLRIRAVLIHPRFAIRTQENNLDDRGDEPYEGDHAQHNQQQEHPAALAGVVESARSDGQRWNESARP